MNLAWKFANRVWDAIEDVINTRALLAAFALGGFFFIANKIVDLLVNPPASELFAILNLVLNPVSFALGYYFGRDKKPNTPQN